LPNLCIEPQEQRMAPISKSHRIALAIGVLCLATSGGVAAQAAGSTGGSGSTAGTTGGAGATPSGGAATSRSAARDATQAADRPFMEKAAMSDMAEIQLSQIAQQKATRDDVKQLAGRMVQDHTRTSSELKTIAAAANVTLPTTVDRKHQQAVQKLQGMTAGADFDRQYLALLLDDHKQAVALFRSESKSGKNPDAKAFAAKTLPALEEHLQMVQAMSKGGGKSAAMGGGTHASSGSGTHSGATSGGSSRGTAGASAGSTTPGGAATGVTPRP
jgi:putative membrane protein